MWVEPAERTETTGRAEYRAEQVIQEVTRDKLRGREFGHGALGGDWVVRSPQVSQCSYSGSMVDCSDGADSRETWWYAPALGQLRQPTLAQGRMLWLVLPPGMEGAQAHGPRWLGMAVVIPEHLMVESEEHTYSSIWLLCRKKVHGCFFLSLFRSVHKKILKSSYSQEQV